MDESALPAPERVEKLDAIRRQLRMAIRLFFEERDRLPIYTLAAAVQELLRDLLVLQGKGSLFKDSDLIRPEKKVEFIALLNRPQNFFKHANRDPEAVLDFHPDTLTFVLFDSVFMYLQYTGRWLREGYVFFLWFIGKNPDFLRDGYPLQKIFETNRELWTACPMRALRTLLDDEFPNTD